MLSKVAATILLANKLEPSIAAQDYKTVHNTVEHCYITQYRSEILKQITETSNIKIKHSIELEFTFQR